VSARARQLTLQSRLRIDLSGGSLCCHCNFSKGLLCSPFTVSRPSQVKCVACYRCFGVGHLCYSPFHSFPLYRLLRASERLFCLVLFVIICNVYYSCPASRIQPAGLIRFIILQVVRIRQGSVAFTLMPGHTTQNAAMSGTMFLPSVRVAYVHFTPLHLYGRVLKRVATTE
jgi:hypothetical protein